MVTVFALKHYEKMAETNQSPETLLRAVKCRLVELRRRKGLSQEQVAELLEVDSRTIQRWEARSEKRVSLWTLCRLSIALDCSIRDFFEENNR